MALTSKHMDLLKKSVRALHPQPILVYKDNSLVLCVTSMTLKNQSDHIYQHRFRGKDITDVLNNESSSFVNSNTGFIEKVDSISEITIQFEHDDWFILSER